MDRHSVSFQRICHYEIFFGWTNAMFCRNNVIFVGCEPQKQTWKVLLQYKQIYTMEWQSQPQHVNAIDSWNSAKCCFSLANWFLSTHSMHWTGNIRNRIMHLIHSLHPTNTKHFILGHKLEKKFNKKCTTKKKLLIIMQCPWSIDFR